MSKVKVTVASLRSVLTDVDQNLDLVKQTCKKAQQEGARLVLFPELMLTGHGGHTLMADNAQSVPNGPLAQEIINLSKECDLAICVGIAELENHQVYNGQMVADKGSYLGLQRKINLSLDEYIHFKAGETVEVFDLGELKFGTLLCYDNQFPELALALSLADVDLIHAPHAARTGEWPKTMDAEFKQSKIQGQQDIWEKFHRARGADHNCYVLLNNAVGSAAGELDDVVANHAGGVMGVAPDGTVFLRTAADDFVDEVVTVDLDLDKRTINHGPGRNRRMETVLQILADAADGLY